MGCRCQSPLSACVVFACFRVCPLESLEPSWLALSPSVLRITPDLRVFDFQAPPRMILIPGLLLSALRRHPSVLSPASPPGSCVVSVDSMRPKIQAPRLRLATLQHIRTEKPHFSLLSKRPASVAMPPGSSTRRVWLPFQWRLSFSTLGDLFQPPTLMGLTLQSFSPTRDPERVSPNLSAPALLHQTSAAWCRRFSGLAPRVSRIPRRVRRFSPDRDRVLSWACDL